jgi:hypothetical protein
MVPNGITAGVPARVIESRIVSYELAVRGFPVCPLKRVLEVFDVFRACG